MIRSFANKATETVFSRGFTKRPPRDLHRAAYRKLVLIHAASRLDDLRGAPGNRLEALKGDRKGHYSIRVNDQFRICFAWRGGDACEVEIVDYH